MAALSKTIPIIAQIIAYIFAAIALFQIISAIRGGTWAAEDIVLSLVISNLGASFGVVGYLINLNNKISDVDRKIDSHLGWHRGRDDKA